MNPVYKVALVVTTVVCAGIILWDLRGRDAGAAPPVRSVAEASGSASAGVEAAGLAESDLSALPSGSSGEKAGEDSAVEAGAETSRSRGESEQVIGHGSTAEGDPGDTRVNAQPMKNAEGKTPEVESPGGPNDHEESSTGLGGGRDGVSAIAVIARGELVEEDESVGSRKNERLGSFFSPGRQGGAAMGADEPRSRDIPADYTIESGDTFSKIARKVYGGERMWVAIRDANPEVDPRRLSVGQVIRLPRAGGVLKKQEAAGTVGGGGRERSGQDSTARLGQGWTYVVKRGDALSSIARRFYHDGSVWRIIYDANRSAIGSNPDRLPRGVRLVIPKRADDG